MIPLRFKRMSQPSIYPEIGTKRPEIQVIHEVIEEDLNKLFGEKGVNIEATGLEKGPKDLGLPIKEAAHIENEPLPTETTNGVELTGTQGYGIDDEPYCYVVDFSLGQEHRWVVVDQEIRVILRRLDNSRGWLPPPLRYTVTGICTVLY
jgi:hypothetical protein